MAQAHDPHSLLEDGADGTAGPFYFAHCYPYTFSHLQEYLREVEADPQRRAVTHRTCLCPTVAGNRCELLVVSNPQRVAYTLAHAADSGGHKPGVLREAIVVSARVRPCRSVWFGNQKIVTVVF